MDALVLHTRRIGEYHKGISCVTPGLGLINAIVYGAYRGKSKFSGITEPFSYVFLHLYYNPVKKVYKVSDAEEKRSFSALKENLSRFYRASLFSEIVLKSHGGGGDSKNIFSLLKEAFSFLNVCDTSKMDLAVIQYLWRFLLLSGMNPDLHFCGRCGRKVGTNEVFLFVPEENAFVCGNCGTSGSFKLNGGERKYLEYTGRQEFEAAVKVGLDTSSVFLLRQFLLSLIQNFLEFPLRSLQNSFF